MPILSLPITISLPVALRFRRRPAGGSCPDRPYHVQQALLAYIIFANNGRRAGSLPQALAIDDIGARPANIASHARRGGHSATIARNPRSQEG